MVAISTDAGHWSRVPPTEPSSAPGAPPGSAGGTSDLWGRTRRFHLVVAVAAVCAVVAVAIATAALGRMLDGHRGIPASVDTAVVGGP